MQADTLDSPPPDAMVSNRGASGALEGTYTLNEGYEAWDVVPAIACGVHVDLGLAIE